MPDQTAARREKLGEKILQISNIQVAVQHDVRHAQAASQAIFKESQALAAKLDAEHLERQAILAERVRIGV